MASFLGYFAQNFFFWQNKVLTVGRTGVIVFNNRKKVLTHEKIFRSRMKRRIL